jgi:Protein of unknown function (DUF2752)
LVRGLDEEDMRASGMNAASPGSAREFGHAEVFAAIFVLSFLAARLLPLLSLPYACPFKALTGLPCATCGMTHAFVYLARGEVRAALAASPLGALLAGGIWLFAAADAAFFALALPLPAPGPRSARALVVAGLIALLANWAFLVVAHRP